MNKIKDVSKLRHIKAFDASHGLLFAAEQRPAFPHGSICLLWNASFIYVFSLVFLL